MDRLVTDVIVRRSAQAIVVAILVGLIALCICVAVFVHLRRVGQLDDPEAAITIFSFLASPLQQTFSAVIALFTVVVPVVFSKVCYVVNSQTTPPSAGPNLNVIGHSAFLLTLLGLLVGTGVLLVFSLDKEALADLAASKENAAAIQGLVNGVIAFNGVYFTQLMGLAPK